MIQDPIDRFIVTRASQNGAGVATAIAEHYGISRQAATARITKLIKAGVLQRNGQGRATTVAPMIMADFTKTFPLHEGGNRSLEENEVYQSLIHPLTSRLPENVIDIWHYGFTEMLNNAIDHSDGTSVSIQVIMDSAVMEVSIYDDGIGIFDKIRAAFNLADKYHAAQELSKGKITTASEQHSGEGIFFTSRVFEKFILHANGLLFMHQESEENDWILDDSVDDATGTRVGLRINHFSERTLDEVFDAFAGGDDFLFDKTVVPVCLTAHSGEKLVSRSQAKRILARFDKFAVAVLDFAGINSIGQAFADEVFRVYPNANPAVAVEYVNANEAVTRMIKRVRGTRL